MSLLSRRRFARPADLPRRGMVARYDVSAEFNKGNLLKYSEDVSNAAWTKNNGATFAGGAVAPNGAATAWTISGSNVGVGCSVAQYLPTGAGAVVNGKTSVVRFWVKAGTSAQVEATIYNNTDSVFVNITPTVVSGAGTPSNITATHVRFAGLTAGWSLVEVRSAVPLADKAYSINIYPNDRLAVHSLDVALWGVHWVLSDWDLGYLPTTDFVRYPNSYGAGSCPLISDISARDVDWALTTERRYRDIYQVTGANQPLITRADNQGNAFGRSEQFEQWTLGGLNAFGATDTGAAGAGSFANTARTLDPAGGNNADFIQQSGATAEHRVSLSLYLATQRPVRLSVYAKAAGTTWLQSMIYDGAAPVASAFFNLATGQVGSTPVENGAVVLGATSESVGNGWYRCVLEAVMPASTSGFCSCYFFLASVDGGPTSFAGDNTSGVYLYGAQLQHASWDPTYVSTSGLPIYPGIGGRKALLFNGTAHYLKGALGLSLSYPATLYAVLEQVSWTASDRIWDGASEALVLGQRTAGVTGEIAQWTGGVASNTTLDFPIGKPAILAAVYDGTNSILQVNGGRLGRTGNDIGSVQGAGFCLGAIGTGVAASFSNIRVGEILIYSGFHDAKTRARVYEYLKRKWRLA